MELKGKGASGGISAKRSTATVFCRQVSLSVSFLVSPSSFRTAQSSFLSASFASSARSLFRSFAGSHISAFNFCKSQSRERVSQSMFSLRGLWPVPRLPVRRRKSVRSLRSGGGLQLRLRIPINFLLFQNPVRGFGHMSGNGHNGLLMILLALDPLIKPYDVLASEVPLMNDHQIAGLDKGPFQIAIDVAADLPKSSMAATGMHAWNQAGVAGQVGSRGKPLDLTDLQSHHHTQNPSYVGQCL
jgi:hypothetical protein